MFDIYFSPDYSLFRKLLHSTEMDISFKAAGILAQLLSGGINSRTNTSINFNKISNELVSRA
jgi:hypothetical protein